MSNSFPSYKLDLPFEHYVIGYLHNFADSFVCVKREHSIHPFVTYHVGQWPTNERELTHRACHHGHYHETMENAMKDLFERYEGTRR